MKGHKEYTIVVTLDSWGVWADQMMPEWWARMEQGCPWDPFLSRDYVWAGAAQGASGLLGTRVSGLLPVALRAPSTPLGPLRPQQSLDQGAGQGVTAYRGHRHRHPRVLEVWSSGLELEGVWCSPRRALWWHGPSRRDSEDGQNFFTYCFVPIILSSPRWTSVKRVLGLLILSCRALSVHSFIFSLFCLHVG